MSAPIFLNTKQTAALIGCSEGQLSESTRKGWRVKGHEPWGWAEIDGNDRVTGYNVPPDVFEALASAKSNPAGGNPAEEGPVGVPHRVGSRIRARRPPSNSGDPAGFYPQPARDDARFERYFEESERRHQHKCDVFEARIERLKDELEAGMRREREGQEKLVLQGMEHQAERQRLFAEHQREVAELKDELRELKADLRIEQAGGEGTPTWERVLQTEAAQSLIGGFGYLMQHMALQGDAGSLVGDGVDEDWEGDDEAVIGLAPPRDNPVLDGASASTGLLGELADLLAQDDGDAFAARVMAAVRDHEVPLKEWARIGGSIIGHVTDAGWDPERLALFALPLLGALPAPYRSVPPGELAQMAQGFVQLSAEEATLVRAALDMAMSG